LVFIPIVMYGIYQVLMNYANMNQALCRGLVVLACLPVTTTTCNVLCKAADGNTAVSLFHSALGNLLGAFYTPSVLLLLLGNQSSVSFVDVLVKIIETLLAPLIAGQIVHNTMSKFTFIQKIQKISGDITKVCLLIIIWNTFCDTFSKKIENVDTQDIVIVIAVVVLSHGFFFFCSYMLYKQPFFGLNRRTQVSAWFCSTQKTIVMGIPLVKIIFEGNPEIGLIQIPLLMYHPTQTLGASFFLGKMNRWVKKDDEEDKETTRLLAEKSDENGTPQVVSIDYSGHGASASPSHSYHSDDSRDAAVPQTPEPSR